MVTKQEILNFVKARGPVIPNQIKKQFGGDTYLISAYLSELSKDGLVKISHTKIGGSPTYYAPGQELKLQDLKKYLNEKDRRTLELLKQKKVLRDKTQEMLIRVSVRNIKDFAKPLEVKVRGEKEIFWKWYLTNNNEVEAIIRKQFSDGPAREVKKEPVKEKEVVKEKGKIEEKKPKEEKQEMLEKSDKPKEGFLKQIHDYFNSKDIQIVEEEIIRKKSDIEFQVIIPSSVGKMEYFCKAKNKKKCNDGDLSSAYIKGQSLKLPVLFLTTGEITKKAKEMLGKEFKGMVVKKI